MKPNVVNLAKQNFGLNGKNHNALNNQVQVPKKGSVDSFKTNVKIGLRKMKIQYQDKLKIAHLNIKSLRNKSDSLSFMIENNADIFTHFRN